MRNLVDEIEGMDYMKIYSHDIKHAKRDYFLYGIDELLKNMERERNVIDLKDYFLATMQLYFDGMIEKDGPWEEREEILRKLYSTGKKMVGSFYSGNGINATLLKEEVLPMYDNIVKYSSSGIPKKRNLNLEFHARNVARFVSDVYRFFRKDELEEIVCIASGGFEPALLLMYVFEEDNMLSLRYSPTRGDKKVKIPRGVPERWVESIVKDKITLLVDDWVDSGKTISEVFKYLSSKKPRKLYGAAVYLNVLDNLIASMESKGLEVEYGKLNDCSYIIKMEMV